MISPAPQVKEKDLAQPYRDWLTVVGYIILPAEKDVFLKLVTDRERDIFVESFWKQRDPTPGTPQNEFKEEHLKRFKYANEYHGRVASRPGWMTDMGRIHIILGTPNSIERFDSVSGLYPCQVWYYYGDKAKGLPTYFSLLFYQRGGGGEFRLYSPVSDGPASLFVDTRTIDQTNYSQLYEKLRELAPTLAGPAFSVIPDEHPAQYTPSPRNAIILAQILDSPKKDVRISYATHFLSYKGIVSTDYLTNYVESSASLALVRDPVLGLDLLHFSLSPQSLSIDYYQPRDQYYCNFKISVSLRRGEAVVFQYSRDFPFYFPPDKVENVQANGLSILDLFPIAEGTFGLTILLQNAVGKEFSVFEKQVTVPAMSGPPALFEPVIGHKIQESSAAATSPFQITGKQLLTDPKGMLGLGDDVAFGLAIINVAREFWQDGTVEVTVAGGQAKDRPAKSLVLKLADEPYARALAFVQSFPARELAPDYYEMTVLLKDGKGAVLARASAPLIVSPSETVPHPVTLTRPIPAANNFMYLYGLAMQYDKLGDFPRAEAAYRKGVEMKPDYPEGLADFADFLLRAKKYDESLRFAEMLKDHEKFLFQHHLLKGLALVEKGEYEPAIQSLLAANRIYNSDTRLLNALGFSYYKTGRKKEAREALAASLRLNTEQPEVKALAAAVEKELK